MKNGFQIGLLCLIVTATFILSAIYLFPEDKPEPCPPPTVIIIQDTATAAAIKELNETMMESMEVQQWRNKNYYRTY